MEVPDISKIFLSTPSARRATTPETWTGRQLNISIHALREEGDFALAVRFGLEVDFYPRPPRGGRQQPEKGMRGIFKFLSTPSARRATYGPGR